MRRSHLVALGLFAALVAPASAAIGQTSLVDLGIVAPMSPTSPTDMQECRDLDAEWKAIRSSIEKQHTECLGASRGGEVGRGSCTYAACQPYHASSSYGRDEVRKCETTVRAHLDEVRKAEAEAKAREEAQKKAAAEAEAARKKEASEGNASPGTDEAAKRRDAETATREREAQEKRARDDEWDRRFRQASQQRERDFAFAMEQQERRETALRSLSSRDRANTSLITALMQGADDAVTSAGRTLRDVLGSLGGSRPAAASPGDFDVGESTARYERVMGNMLSLGSFYVPWSGIPLAMAANSATASLELTDQLTRTIRDFEHADPAALNAAFEAFPQRALGLRPLVTAVSDAAIGGYLQQTVARPVIDEAVEAVKLRARLAVDDQSAAIMWRVAPQNGREPLFWSERPAPIPPPLRRDAAGTVLLFGPDGRAAFRDPTTQRAQYPAAQVEQLVARTDLLPAPVSPTRWERRTTAFVWDVKKEEPGVYDEALREWVAGQFTGTLMAPPSKARDRIWDAAEKPR